MYSQTDGADGIVLLSGTPHNSPGFTRLIICILATNSINTVLTIFSGDGYLPADTARLFDNPEAIAFL